MFEGFGESFRLLSISKLKIEVSECRQLKRLGYFLAFLPIRGGCPDGGFVVRCGEVDLRQSPSLGFVFLGIVCHNFHAVRVNHAEMELILEGIDAVLGRVHLDRYL